ncbi:MAG: T9SS type A sorting domain-containing protein [Salibacteraceae bacterium]
MKLFNTFIFIIIAVQFSFGQCTPDPKYTAPGYYSSAGLGYLVNAQKGTFYDETITIIAPKDTVGLTVDSIILIRVKDLPTGLTYAVLSPTIKGGEKGCAQITGTPSVTPGTYDIKMDIKLYIRGIPVQDRTESLPLYVDFPAGLDVGNFDDSKVSIAPNPVEGIGTLNMYNYSTEVIEFKIFNLLGNVVFDETYFVDSKNAQLKFDVSDLPQGLYMYNVKVGDQTKVGRMMVSGN